MLLSRRRCGRTSSSAPTHSCVPMSRVGYACCAAPKTHSSPSLHCPRRTRRRALGAVSWVAHAASTAGRSVSSGTAAASMRAGASRGAPLRRWRAPYRRRPISWKRWRCAAWVRSRPARAVSRSSTRSAPTRVRDAPTIRSRMAFCTPHLLGSPQSRQVQVRATAARAAVARPWELATLSLNLTSP